MWHRLFGLAIVGGIVLGQASTANAQVVLSVGNPYTRGVALGQPLGYGYGYPYAGTTYSSFYASPLAGTTIYNSGYAGYVAPGVSVYRSGYAGYVAPAVGVYPSGYLSTAAYGYPAYAYAPYYGGGYGVYGVRTGPFRRWNRGVWGW